MFVPAYSSAHARSDSKESSRPTSPASSGGGAPQARVVSGSLKDRIAKFENLAASGPAPAPIPRPWERAASGSYARGGLVGNRIPSLDRKTEAFVAGQRRGATEKQGLIGNRIPSGTGAATALASQFPASSVGTTSRSDGGDTAPSTGIGLGRPSGSERSASPISAASAAGSSAIDGSDASSRTSSPATSPGGHIPPQLVVSSLPDQGDAGAMTPSSTRAEAGEEASEMSMPTTPVAQNPELPPPEFDLVPGNLNLAAGGVAPSPSISSSLASQYDPVDEEEEDANLKDVSGVSTPTGTPRQAHRLLDDDRSIAGSSRSERSVDDDVTAKVAALQIDTDKNTAAEEERTPEVSTFESSVSAASDDHFEKEATPMPEREITPPAHQQDSKDETPITIEEPVPVKAEPKADSTSLSQQQEDSDTKPASEATSKPSEGSTPAESSSSESRASTATATEREPVPVEATKPVIAGVPAVEDKEEPGTSSTASARRTVEVEEAKPVDTAKPVEEAKPGLDKGLDPNTAGPSSDNIPVPITPEHVATLSEYLPSSAEESAANAEPATLAPETSTAVPTSSDARDRDITPQASQLLGLRRSPIDNFTQHDSTFSTFNGTLDDLTHRGSTLHSLDREEQPAPALDDDSDIVSISGGAASDALDDLRSNRSSMPPARASSELEFRYEDLHEQFFRDSSAHQDVPDAATDSTRTSSAFVAEGDGVRGGQGSGQVQSGEAALGVGASGSDLPVANMNGQRASVDSQSTVNEESFPSVPSGSVGHRPVHIHVEPSPHGALPERQAEAASTGSTRSETPSMSVPSTNGSDLDRSATPLAPRFPDAPTVDPTGTPSRQATPQPNVPSSVVHSFPEVPDEKHPYVEVHVSPHHASGSGSSSHGVPFPRGAESPSPTRHYSETLPSPPVISSYPSHESVMEPAARPMGSMNTHGLVPSSSTPAGNTLCSLSMLAAGSIPRRSSSLRVSRANTPPYTFVTTFESPSRTSLASSGGHSSDNSPARLSNEMPRRKRNSYSPRSPYLDDEDPGDFEPGEGWAVVGGWSSWR